MARRTVAQAFGARTADELARWAIDVLCDGEVPAGAAKYAYAAKVPWRLLDEGRALLDRAGVDWRTLHKASRERYREHAEKVDAERRVRLREEQISRGR